MNESLPVWLKQWLKTLTNAERPLPKEDPFNFILTFPPNPFWWRISLMAPTLLSIMSDGAITWHPTKQNQKWAKNFKMLLFEEIMCISQGNVHVYMYGTSSEQKKCWLYCIHHWWEFLFYSFSTLFILKSYMVVIKILFW